MTSHPAPRGVPPAQFGVPFDPLDASDGDTRRYTVHPAPPRPVPPRPVRRTLHSQLRPRRAPRAARPAQVLSKSLLRARAHQ